MLTHPLRNRVTPTGELIATEHRGTMYGNRGVLHNDDLVLVRRHQVRRWLVCVLEFRGRQRQIMRPRRYTELFFLDEAVALAAGHRPCAECRYVDYQLFRTAWTAALGLRSKPTADDIDLVLHAQRGLVDGVRATHQATAGRPARRRVHRLAGRVLAAAQRESPPVDAAGYTERRKPFDGTAPVLTPRSTVDTMRAGYRPGTHQSANE